VRPSSICALSHLAGAIRNTRCGFRRARADETAITPLARWLHHGPTA
jgi:hypothetical protein